MNGGSTVFAPEPFPWRLRLSVAPDVYDPSGEVLVFGESRPGLLCDVLATVSSSREDTVPRAETARVDTAPWEDTAPWVEGPSVYV